MGYIIFTLLFLLVICWLMYYAYKFRNPYKLIMVFGKKGAGKIYCEVPATSSKVSVSYEILDDQKFVDFIAK